MAEVALPADRDLVRLFEALGAGEGASRIIGGWVRDTLLGLHPADIDIATRLTPQQAEARAKGAGFTVWSSPSGIAHGTIGVVAGGRSIEVTTLRRDVATDGRHAEIAFTDNWREDAARRDFTINALSADPLTGAVHDYFGGLADLADGCVRFLGDPSTRIAEDHLRILRFFRFFARFGRGEPDAASFAACTARAKDLMALSRERIAGELLKLLAVAHPVPAVEAMLAGGIFAPVLPEIVDAGRLSALVEAERAAAVPADGLRRLAALLPPNEAIADGVGGRLRLSKADRKRLTLAAAPPEGAPQVLAYRIGLDSAIDRLLLAGRPGDAAALAGWSRPIFPLTGGALVAMGLVAGPDVARTLRAIETQWLEEGFPEANRVTAIAREKVAQALADRQ